MARKAAEDEAKPDHPPGEWLPPIEDFVRKMSGKFAGIPIPEASENDDES